jgi:hypothetical protein
LKNTNKTQIVFYLVLDFGFYFILEMRKRDNKSISSRRKSKKIKIVPDRSSEQWFFSVLGNKYLLEYIVSFQHGYKISWILAKKDASLLCMNGCLSLLQYLGVERLVFNAQCMDYAAARGDLEMLKWLQKNVKGISITKSGMDCAALNGHLKVVKWLLENRIEGCTKRALRMAALNGHMEVVQLLHINRGPEVPSKKAMEYATRGGHLQIVKWLHEQSKKGCTV